MAGLGSLEKSKVFKNIQRPLEELEDLMETTEMAPVEAEQDANKEGNGDFVLSSKCCINFFYQGAREESLGMNEEVMDFGGQKISGASQSVGEGGPLESDQRLQGVERSRVIDILLVESDTIWMLELSGKILAWKKRIIEEENTENQLDLGTCVETDPDSSTNKQTEDGENGDKNEEDEKKSVDNAAAKTSSAAVAKYELIESWSQTLDFSKKKKGTQCDDIEIESVTTQVIFLSSFKFIL